MAKRRNAQESTVRNDRASLRRDNALTTALMYVQARVRVCEARIDELDRIIEKNDLDEQRKPTRTRR